MKILKSDCHRFAGMITLCGAILSASTSLRADSIYTINNTTADAFLAGNSPTLNYGLAGTLAVAPAGSPKGEFDSIIEFNTAAAVIQFNSTYGAGNWQITAFTLSLASNFGTNGAKPGTQFNTISGGNFNIDWLADNTWVEGTGNGMGTPASGGAVDFNSISSLFTAGSASLGTFTYSPPGNNVYASYSLPLNSSLVSSAAAGGGVSLYFSAADSQVSYLFNSKDYNQTPSNHPELTIDAAPVPEPGTLSLAASALACLLISRRLKQRQ